MTKQTTISARSRYTRLADYLQQQRRNHRISVRKISQLTNLPESTIRALEQPSKSTLPNSNIVGLYKLYGSALGITQKRVNDLAGSDNQQKPEFLVRRLPKLKSLVVFSNIGTTSVIVIILVLVIGYSTWQGFALIASPSLSVNSPAHQYMIVNNAKFVIRGQADSEATVLINGQPTTTDNETGQFEQDTYLQAGYNHIIVESVNSFSHKNSKDFVVIYNRQ